MKVFEDFCVFLEVKKLKTTPYYMQKNEKIERFNCTLVRIQRHYVSKLQKDWES